MRTDKVINLSLLVLSDDFEMHNCKVLNYGNNGRNCQNPFGMVTVSLLTKVHLIKGLFKAECFVLPFVQHVPEIFRRVLGGPKRNKSSTFPQNLFPRNTLMTCCRQSSVCFGHPDIFYMLLAFPGGMLHKLC